MRGNTDAYWDVIPCTDVLGDDAAYIIKLVFFLLALQPIGGCILQPSSGL